MTTGERIKKRRIKQGLTQNELGKLIGTSQQMIAQYENSLRKPKLETLEKIAQALDITAAELSDATIFSDISFNLSIDKDKNPSRGLSIINQCYYKLNKIGKQEAIKRVSELTEIRKYTDPDETLATDPDHK